MSEKKDIQWINYARGGGIVLVVLGHVISGIQGTKVNFSNEILLTVYDLVNMFHMSLFFVVSGYLYKFNYKSSIKEYLKYVVDKLIKFGIPYLIFNLLYVLCGLVINDEKYTISNLFFIWIKPISHFWFLYALCVIMMLYPILESIFREKIQLMLAILLALSILITPYIGGILNKIIFFIPFFAIGNFLKKKVEVKALLSIKCYGVSCILYIIFAIILLNYSKCVSVAVLCGFSGTFMFINIMNWLCKNVYLDRMFAYLGKETMPIYLCHSLFVSIFRVLFIKLNINNEWILVLSGVLVGVGFPLIIREILRVIPKGDFIFYPKLISKGVKKHE